MNEQQQEPAISPDSAVDPVVLGLAILICSFICMLAYFLFAVFFAYEISFWRPLAMACGIESDNFAAGPEASILNDTFILVVTLTTLTLPFALKIARLARE